MPTVHLRINDATTNLPTAVRLRLTGPNGEAYAPFGRSVAIPLGRGEEVGAGLALGRERWFPIDGACEVALPAETPIRLQAAKGPFFTPIDETFTLGPGQISRRTTITRRHDPKAGGWYGADLRSHFITPHAAALEADAEDLDLAAVQALDFPDAMLDGRTYLTTPNLDAFSGPTAYPYPGRAARIAVGTLNRHAVLGQVGLVGSHRIVFPLTFGPPDATDDWSLIDWCDQCRRKNGLPIWIDPFTTISGVNSGEGLIALILGKLNHLEFDGEPRKQSLLPVTYRLLNAGIDVGLVGSTGKETNRVQLGGVRTYAKLPVDTPLTLPRWIEAFRAGPSLVTNGPWLTLTHDNGVFHAKAECIAPFDALELLAHGVPIAKVLPTAANGWWTASLEHTPDKPANWFAARVGGPASPLNPSQPLFAHTSPLHFPGAAPLRRSESDLAVFRNAIESTIDWIEAHGRFNEPRRRDAMLGYAREALGKLEVANPA